jgi:uncharacterized protein YxjI
MQSQALSQDQRWNYPGYYLKRQIFKLVGSNFFIYESSGSLVFFVHQKGFKLKEDITVFADEQKTTPLLYIRARQIMDMSAAYDVIDATTNERVGVLKRKGWHSIARDEWMVCDANEVQFGQLIEDTLLMALLRRLLTNLIPQNYDLLVNEQRMIDIRQNFNPFSYHLNVDCTSDPQKTVDRRLVIAGAVLLAAIEGRQR